MDQSEIPLFLSSSSIFLRSAFVNATWKYVCAPRASSFDSPFRGFRFIPADSRYFHKTRLKAARARHERIIFTVNSFSWNSSFPLLYSPRSFSNVCSCRLYSFGVQERLDYKGRETSATNLADSFSRACFARRREIKRIPLAVFSAELSTRFSGL